MKVILDAISYEGGYVDTGTRIYTRYKVFDSGLIKIKTEFAQESGSNGGDHIVHSSVQVDRNTIEKMKAAIAEMKDREINELEIIGGGGWIFQAYDDEGNELFERVSGIGYMFIEGMGGLLELLPKDPAE